LQEPEFQLLVLNVDVHVGDDGLRVRAVAMRS
jgi:hypothetical protein